MMTKRRFFFLTSSLVTVAGFVACGFPSITVGPGGAGGAEAGTESGGNGSESGTDAGGDVDIGDVIVRDDASGKIDAAGCDMDANCDCDDDKYLRKDCGDAGPDEENWDCDDLDKDRHPNAAFVVDPSATDQDWDCDGEVEKAYGKFACGGLLCADNNPGFKQDPGCGNSAEYYQCSGACSDEFVNSRPQACK